MSSIQEDLLLLDNSLGYLAPLNDLRPYSGYTALLERVRQDMHGSSLKPTLEQIKKHGSLMDRLDGLMDTTDNAESSSTIYEPTASPIMNSLEYLTDILSESKTKEDQSIGPQKSLSSQHHWDLTSSSELEMTLSSSTGESTEGYTSSSQEAPIQTSQGWLRQDPIHRHVLKWNPKMVCKNCRNPQRNCLCYQPSEEEDVTLNKTSHIKKKRRLN